MEFITLYNTFQQKGKGMKSTKYRRHVGLSLLFTFSLVKWILFYTIKGGAATDFKI